MEIGVVVHGPNIIDSNWALKLINLLSGYGDVSARLGGTMGRTAVIDESLEDIIDISKKLVPSDSLKLFNDADMDVIFLINYGKSDVTGQVFASCIRDHDIKITSVVSDKKNRLVRNILLTDDSELDPGKADNHFKCPLDDPQTGIIHCLFADFPNQPFNSKNRNADDQE